MDWIGLALALDGHKAVLLLSTQIAFGLYFWSGGLWKKVWCSGDDDDDAVAVLMLFS